MDLEFPVCAVPDWGETARGGLGPGLLPIPSYSLPGSFPYCWGLGHTHVILKCHHKLRPHPLQTRAPRLSLGSRGVTLAGKRPEQALPVGREFSGPEYSEWPAPWVGTSLSALQTLPGGRGNLWTGASLLKCENATEWRGVPRGWNAAMVNMSNSRGGWFPS